jgi:hypothetical protein
MPVIEKLPRGALPEEAALREELERELQAPSQALEPIIVVERPHASTIHLFGIWSKFEPLEQLVRSRILLDAFEAVRGKEEALKVTVSMGLTPDEARRLGIG